MEIDTGILSVLGSPPPGSAEFNTKCLEYFMAQYKKRISSTESLKKYPLPPQLDDGVLPYLLNDEEFFFSCRLIQIEQERFKYKGSRYYLIWFLWEMFGMEPEKFLEFHEELVLQTNPKPNQGTDNIHSRTWLGLESSLGKIFKSRITQTFFLLWKDLCRLKRDTKHPYSKSLPMLKGQLEDLVVDLEDNELEGCWSYLQEPATVNPKTTEELRFQLPLYNGLCQYILSQYPDQMRKLLNLSLNGVPDLSSLHEPIGHTLKPTSPEHGDVFLLLNDMGTGETQAILNTMCERWGIYLMAPSLEPSMLYTAANAQLSNDGDIEVSYEISKRYFASSDTYSAFKDSQSWNNDKRLGYWKQINQTNGHSPPVAAELHRIEAMLDANAILKARSALLQTYLSMERPSKIQWALLQISRTHSDDLFDLAYRLHRLISFNNQDLKSTQKRQTYHSFDLFIDESQHAMGNTIAEHIQDSLIQLSPMTYLSGSSIKLLEVLNHVSEYNSRASIYNNFEYINEVKAFEDSLRKRALYTAREAYEIRQRGKEGSRFPSFFRGGKPLKSRIKLPEGNDWNLIQEALKMWDIFTETGKNMIRKVCRAFFGRAHWASLFTDELLRATSKHQGTLTDRGLQEVGTKTSKSIKGIIKRQVNLNKSVKWSAGFLRSMASKESNVGKVLNEKLDSVQMELGMKEARRGYSRRAFSETILTEMKVESLRESNDYSELMLQFSRSLNNDYSNSEAIGSSSGYIFATILYDFLLSNRSVGMDGVVSQHRGSFLNQIRGSTKWKDLTNLETDFTGYVLNGTGLVPGQAEFLREPVEAWLRNSNRSTFLFPDGDESPSLLFFLQKPNQGLSKGSSEHSSILCSMKFVTGASRKEAFDRLSVTLRNLVISTRSCRSPVVHIFVSNLLEIPPGLLENVLRNRLPLKTLQARKGLLTVIKRNNNEIVNQGGTVGKTIESLENADPMTWDNNKLHDDLEGLLKQLLDTADQLKGNKTQYYDKNESWLGDYHYVRCIDKTAADHIWRVPS